MLRLCSLTVIAWLPFAGSALAQDIFERYGSERREPIAQAQGTDLREAVLREIELGLEGSDLPAQVEVVLETISPAPPDILMVEHVSHDQTTGRFTAQVMEMDGSSLIVHGRAPVSVPVWMPARRLASGEIIAQADLAEFRLPLVSVKSTMLVHPEDMIGKEVRRSLLAERPVVERSLIAPRIVLRGSGVTISFDNGLMALSAPGRAMEDGGSGQLIRVLNTQSNKIVQAEVLGKGDVRVGPEGEP